jgi:hypothetical protein
MVTGAYPKGPGPRRIIGAVTVLGRVLLLPFRPGAAAARLEGRPAALLFALVAPSLLGAALAATGCSAPDAAATACSLLLVVAGMGLLGAAACQPASLLAGARRPVWAALPACFVAAGWAPLLFAALAAAMVALGFGPSAPLAASLALLGWGVVLGIGLVGAGDAEPGRRLVASCLGLVGTLLGLWLALALATAHLVLAVPAPVAEWGFERGDLLLVRRQSTALPGSLVVVQAPGSPEVAFGRIDAHGMPIPARSGAGVWSRKPDVLGRVFFKLGAGRAGPVGIPGHSP